MGLDLSALDDELAADGLSRWLAPVAPLDAFEEDPDNPRFEDEGPEFDHLVEDVRLRGILQPVVVRCMASGRLRIRFGMRRYRAACRLQLPGLPYVVTEDVRQFDDYAQVSENAQRKSLQPLELAAFIDRKLALGQKKREVAARLKINPSEVTHLLALTGDVPPLVLELYHSRRCRTPQYLYEIRKLLRGDAALVTPLLVAASEVDRRLLGELYQRVRREATLLADGVAVSGAVPVPPKPARASQGAATSLRGSSAVGSPVLTAIQGGRRVVVNLTRTPSTMALIWVRADGAWVDEEVSIGELQLSGLTFST